eukprot:TRINITY_DN62930_c0_g1_i1.p1 TRINITY_DN62930_c0_g1~~TRINITY_DN62930_c0_g1_i1.p1  ORF type:complete len:136 (-),score=38.34 TRINITY_DN62930_c0_g1_i1:276-683(-)
MLFCSSVFFFFFKQKTAYEMLRSLVGSEMCIRDRFTATNIFAGGTEDQKMLLVQMGVLQLIVQWLKHSNAGDFQILCNCLEGIENILQCEFGPSCANLLAEHGFLEVLQDLSNSHNQSVARMATQIGNTYFSESN